MDILKQQGLCKNISKTHQTDRKSRYEAACSNVPEERAEQPVALPHKAPEIETHHFGWGQHQDDKANLTGVLPPVLWSNQPADAHVPLL